MDVLKIMQILPHRHPFLLVDRVVEYEPWQHLIGIKNVTATEPFFTGHFPDQPIMPGVLIIEAMAQTTGLLAAVSAPDLAAKKLIYYLVGVDKVRFKRPVVPGDRLRLEARYLRHRRNIWSFACTSEVDGEMVASAEIMCAAKFQEES